MNRSNIRFIFFLVVITAATLVILMIIEYYHRSLPLGDYYNIASIIQGTLGVAVSLAGAIVAIKLAQLSTAIVEKEKKREDAKTFHQVMDESLKPIKNLTDSFQSLFDTAIDHSRDLVPPRSHQQPWQPDLGLLKQAVLHNLDEIANALKQLSESQFAYSLWLHLAKKRSASHTLLFRGGSVGYDLLEDNDNSGVQNSFLLMDLNQLYQSIKRVRQRFSGCELTANDITVAQQIGQNGLVAMHQKDNNIFSITLQEQAYVTLISLISMHYNYVHSVYRLKPDVGNFQNKMALFILDVLLHVPSKRDLIDFALILFPSQDQEIIEQSPVITAFEIVGDAYWMNYSSASIFKNVDKKELAANDYGAQFSSPLCQKLWSKWQYQKEGLYPFQ